MKIISKIDTKILKKEIEGWIIKPGCLRTYDEWRKLLSKYDYYNYSHKNINDWFLYLGKITIYKLYMDVINFKKQHSLNIYIYY